MNYLEIKDKFKKVFLLGKKLNLEKNIHLNTKSLRKDIITWAEQRCQMESNDNADPRNFDADDEIQYQGNLLRRKCLEKFKNYYRIYAKNRFLIHVPPMNFSPAGYSLFSNLIKSLNYLGLKAESLSWNDNLEEKLKTLEPTIFLTSDHSFFLKKISWREINKYREKKNYSLA